MILVLILFLCPFLFFILPLAVWFAGVYVVRCVRAMLRPCPYNLEPPRRTQWPTARKETT